MRNKIPEKIESSVTLARSCWQKTKKEFQSLVRQGSATLVASLAITGIIVGLRQGQVLQFLELKAYDQMLKLTPSSPEKPDILIIGIEEEDIQNQKEWPISDKTLGEVIERLQKYHPKVIAIDLFRDIANPPGEDKLKKAFQADNVIGIYKLGDEGGYETPPPPSLPTDRIGFADIPIDVDNIVRRYLLYGEAYEEQFYSLALQVVRHYLRENNKPLAVNIQDESLHIGPVLFQSLSTGSGGYQMSPGEAAGWQMLLKYSLKEDIVHQITLKEALEGKINPDWVKDKIVLIGATASSERDQFGTPYSDGSSNRYFMPGVQIHAQAIHQMLATIVDHQPLFWFFPQWGEGIWIWVWSLVGGVIVWRCNRPIVLIGVMGVTGVGIWGISFLLFLSSAWVPVVPPILGLLATGTTVLGYKFFSSLYYDPLTHLPNRRLFIQHLAKLNQHNRQKKLASPESIAVLFVGLDRFKEVNEGLGHLAGDCLLIAVAERLQETLDKPAFLARVGGDEFALCLHPLGNLETAKNMAENLQKSFKVSFLWKNEEIYTGLSIGIAYYQGEESFEEQELLRDAHIAMYNAKTSGKVHSVVFDDSMRKRAIDRWQTETELRKALEKEEFVLFYQPIISLKTGKIAGFEALVRWQSSHRGFVSPGDFIPIAEETGLIIPMGAWILQEACQQMETWHQQFPQNPPLMISVNLSGRQFSQPDLVQQIQHILEKINLERKTLKLEITESMMMNDVESAIDLLRRLKNLGLRLSIDDFGTGYSSLSYLHRFPVDTLKVDQSFVRLMNSTEEHDKYTQIVLTVIMLGHNLELDVIAEGIETEEQMKILQSLNCEYGQGFFFSRPLSSEQATALLSENIQWKI